MKKNIVLLHGYGFSSDIWSPIIPQLEKHFTVQAIDLPGFGEKQQSLLSHFPEEVANTLLKECPNKAVYLGWSLGGLIATAIALHYPKRIQHLITVNSTPKFIAEDHWPGVEKRFFNDFKSDMILNPESTLQHFYRSLMPKKKNNAMIRASLKSKIYATPKPSYPALLSGLKLLETTDFRAELHQITAPQTYIIGTPDHLTPACLANEYSKLSSNCQTKLIEQGTHLPFLTQPDCFIRHV